MEPIYHDLHAFQSTGRLPDPEGDRIGVIIPANFMLGRQIIKGVSRYCEHHPDLKLELISINGRSVIPNWKLKGRKCIIAQVPTMEHLSRLKEHSGHLVLTTSRFAANQVPRVINDDIAIGRMGAEYLLSLGHRRLVFLSHPSLLFAVEREKGFTQAAMEAGAELHILQNLVDAKKGAVADLLLSFDGPTAVMAPSDLHARGLMECFPDPKAVIPERIAVLGVDDDPLENHLSPVALSSIRLAGERLGFEAAALGMRMAAGGPQPREPILIAPSHVVVRRSTSRLAGTDKWVDRAMRLIRDNLGDLQGVADVVAALDINRRPLEMRFRKQLGSSIAHELTRARIQRACELLSSTDLSIKEVAYLVGYSEPRMLSIAFKRETGERPSEYLRRVRPG